MKKKFRKKSKNEKKSKFFIQKLKFSLVFKNLNETSF
jgi:hypothetical protein